MQLVEPFLLKWMEMMFFFIALIEGPIGDKHVDTYKKYIKYFISKNKKNLIF
jgi:hypothetical protein